VSAHPGQTTSDLITGALRLLAEPVDVPDDTRPEDVEIVLRDALRARVDAWLAAAGAKIVALYHLHAAATSRADTYAAEADRWARLAARERDTAAWAQQRAGDLLVAERRLAGFGDDESYAVTLPNGAKPGLKLNPPAVEVLDPAAVPPELHRVVPEQRAPDKVAIKAVLAAGRDVPGCRLTRGQRFDWGEPRRRA